MKFLGVVILCGFLNSFAFAGDPSIKPQDRILDSREVGEVVLVFPDGTSNVRLDGQFGFYRRATRDLGKGYQCIEAICKGTKFYNSINGAGEILEVFDNGYARVKFDAYFGFHVSSFNELGLKLNCQLRENCRLKELKKAHFWNSWD